MTYRRSFALAFVAFCAACGSSGGTGDLVQVGHEQPDYPEQGAANDYDEPVDSFGSLPTDPQQPEFNDDAPPSSPGGGPPVSSSTCEEICGAFIAAGCVEEQPGECVAECSNPEDEIAACINEYLALLACVVDSPRFACVDGELAIDAEELFAECPAESDAYFQCYIANQPPEPQPDPPPTQNCTLDGGCVCADDCSECMCIFEDAAFCTDVCI